MHCYPIAQKLSVGSHCLSLTFKALRNQLELPPPITSTLLAKSNILAQLVRSFPPNIWPFAFILFLSYLNIPLSFKVFRAAYGQITRTAPPRHSPLGLAPLALLAQLIQHLPHIPFYCYAVMCRLIDYMV